MTHTTLSALLCLHANQSQAAENQDLTYIRKAMNTRERAPGLIN